MAVGSTEAIRDWFNASFYNKEEIDNLFIQNNQQGLIPYDLMITGDQPEQKIKLVGQTSGKTYNIYLAALMGEDMKETILWSTITLNDDWTKYKFICVLTSDPTNGDDVSYIMSTLYPISVLQTLTFSKTKTIGACNDGGAIWYKLTSNTVLTLKYASSGHLIYAILGYS